MLAYAMDVLYPVRTEGRYIVLVTPWPRIPEKEERDIAGVQNKKPYVYKRQGNRWDQYGESSSATSSEAHIASDQVNSELTWGPWLPSEPATSLVFLDCPSRPYLCLHLFFFVPFISATELHISTCTCVLNFGVSISVTPHPCVETT